MGKMEMLEENINIVQLQSRVLDFLNKENTPFERVRTQKGDTFIISSKQATLELTVDKEWVGYDLSIAKDILGKELGCSVDTDNYKLDGENTKITLDIFSEALYCLEGLLHKKIYVARLKKKYLLAVPISHNNYKTITSSRFSSNVCESISESEVRSLDNLFAVE